MTDSHSALFYAGGCIPTSVLSDDAPVPKKNPFLENAASLFPQIQLPTEASDEAFTSALSEGLLQLHQSIMSDANILALPPHLQPLPPASPRQPLAPSLNDSLYTDFGHSSRLAAQNGGSVIAHAHAYPRSPSPPGSPFASCPSPLFASSPSSSSSSLSASPSSSAPSSPSAQPADLATAPKKCFEIILDFQPVRADIHHTWGVGSLNYPLGADKEYQNARSRLDSLVHPTVDPARDYPTELTLRRLALLQSWAPALDSLSLSNKSAVWSTCLLSPFFGTYIQSSFRRTLKLWAQDPQEHAQSIRILFAALGYLKNQDVLKNQFICLVTGHHIFRTFVFEEPQEPEISAPVAPPKLKSPALMTVPIQVPPPAGHSAVDILAAAAILALYEEELDTHSTKSPEAPSTKTAKRSVRSFDSSARSSKKQHSHDIRHSSSTFDNPLDRNMNLPLDIPFCRSRVRI